MTASEKPPFRPKPFLFRTLAAVFAAQFLMAGYALWRCSHGGPSNELKISERCPDLGLRTENLFSLAVTTVLSLLTNTEHEGPAQ